MKILSDDDYYYCCHSNSRLFPNGSNTHFNVLALACRMEGRHCRACAKKMVRESEALIVASTSRKQLITSAAAAVHYLRYDDVPPSKEQFACNNYACSNSTTFYRCQKCSLLAISKHFGNYCSRECQLKCYQQHDQLHERISKTGQRLHELHSRSVTLKSNPLDVIAKVAACTLPASILLNLLEISYSCPQHLPALDQQHSLKILFVGCTDAVEGQVDFEMLFDLLKSFLYPRLTIMHITLVGPEISSKALQLHSSSKYSICRTLGRVQRLFSVDGRVNGSYNPTTALSTYSFIALMNPNIYGDMASWDEALQVMLCSGLLVIATSSSLFARCSDDALYDDIVLQHHSHANILVKSTKNPLFSDRNCYITASSTSNLHRADACEDDDSTNIFDLLDIPIPNMYYSAFQGCLSMGRSQHSSHQRYDHLLPIIRAAFLRSEAHGLKKTCLQLPHNGDVDVLESILMDMAEDISEGRVTFPSTLSNHELRTIAEKKASSLVSSSRQHDEKDVSCSSSSSRAKGIVPAAVSVRKWEQDRTKEYMREHFVVEQSSTGLLHKPLWRAAGDPHRLPVRTEHQLKFTRK